MLADGLRCVLLTAVLVAAMSTFGASADGEVGAVKQPTIQPFVTAGHRKQVSVSALSSDGRYLLTGSVDKTVILWDVKTQQPLQTFHGHRTVVTAVAFSPDRQQIATGDNNGTVIIWNLKTGRKIRTLKSIWPTSEEHTGRRTRQMLFRSEDLRHRINIWDRFWGLDMPDVATPERTNGGVISVPIERDNDFCCCSVNDQPAEANREISPIDEEDDETLKLLRQFQKTNIPDIEDYESPQGDGAEYGFVKRAGAFQQGMNAICSIAFHPNGGQLLSGSVGGDLVLWNAKTGLRITVLQKRTRRRSWQFLVVCFSPDGKQALSGGMDHSASLWDLKTFKRVRYLLGHTGGVNSVAFRSDGQQILTGADDGRVILWERKTGDKLQILQHPEQSKGSTFYVQHVAFHSNGKEIVVGFNQQSIVDMYNLQVVRWNLKTKKNVNLFQKSQQGFFSQMEIGVDGKRGFVFESDSTITLWTADEKRKPVVQKFSLRTERAKVVAVSSDGRRFFVRKKNGKAALWELRAGKLVVTPWKTAVLNDIVTFSPNGQQILLWTAATSKKPQAIPRAAPMKAMKTAPLMIQKPPQKLYRAQNFWTTDPPRGLIQPRGLFQPRGLIQQRSQARQLTLWNVATQKKLHAFPIPVFDSKHYPILFNPTGKQFLARSRSGLFTLWNTKTGKKDCVIGDKDRSNLSAAFDPAGKWILTIRTGNADDPIAAGNQVLFHDTKTGEKLRHLTVHSKKHVKKSPNELFTLDNFTCFVWAVHPNGKQLLIRWPETYRMNLIGGIDGPGGFNTISVPGELHLVDMKTGKVIRRFSGDAINARFSPDGKQFLTESVDLTNNHWKATTLWETKTGKKLRSTFHENDLSASMTFAANGQRFIAASKIGTIQLWDTTTGKKLCQVQSFNGGNDWVAISSEGFVDGSPGGLKRVKGRLVRGGKMVILSTKETLKQRRRKGLLSALVTGKK